MHESSAPRTLNDTEIAAFMYQRGHRLEQATLEPLEAVKADFLGLLSGQGQRAQYLTPAAFCHQLVEHFGGDFRIEHEGVEIGRVEGNGRVATGQLAALEPFVFQQPSEGLGRCV